MARFSTHSTGSILDRGDVQFLSRKRETGGTPTPPGVDFVRYRRSHGLGFRATGPQTPRIAVRTVFRARHGSGGGSGAIRSARDSACGWILTASPVATEFPAGGFGEDRVGRIPAHEGETPGGGTGDGVRGVEHPAARRSSGGPETGGSEGARPPASPCRGTREAWPQRVGWLSRISGRPTSPWATRPSGVATRRPFGGGALRRAVPEIRSNGPREAGRALKQRSAKPR